jgi:excisionase family DNA binding protein
MTRRFPEQVVFPWGPEASSKPVSREAAPSTPTPSKTRSEAQPALPGGLSAWLTADAATVYLGFPSRKALYAAVERGQVPAHRLGRRRLRFRLEELDTLLGRLHESEGVH